MPKKQRTKELKMAQYQLTGSEEFTNPLTGERHKPTGLIAPSFINENDDPKMKSDVVEMPFDEEFHIGDENHLAQFDPNVHWIPLNDLAVTAIESVIDFKEGAKAKWKERVEELGGGQEARDQVAQEMLHEANGHITNLGNIKAKLREKMKEAKEARAKQLRDRVARNQTALERANAAFRPSDQSVLQPK